MAVESMSEKIGKFFSRVVGRSGSRGVPVDRSSAAGALLEGVYPSQRGVPPVRGTDAILMGYDTMPWIRSVAGNVGNSIAAVTWHVYVARDPKTGRAICDRALQAASGRTYESLVARHKLMAQRKAAGALEEVSDHLLIDLIYGSNPLMPGGSVRKLNQIYMDLAGECFQLIERNVLGAPMRLWPIPPTWIAETPTPSRPYYLIRVGSFSAEVPASEIIWAKDLDPVNPYHRGVGLGRAAADESETDEYAAKTAKQIFWNRGAPQLLITPDPADPAFKDDGGSRENMKRLETSWLQKNRGFWNWFKPMFSTRALKIMELTQDLGSLQFTEIRKAQRDVIRQLWGLPPEELGIIEESNQQQALASRDIKARNVLVPRLEFWREIYQETVAPMFDENLIVDFDSPVVADREHILKAMGAAPWAFSKNEWRGQAQAEPVPVDYVMVPFNLKPVPVEDAGKPVSARSMHARALAGAATKSKPRATKEGGDEDDPAYQLIHRIADRLSPKIRAAFLEAVETAREAIDLAQLELALESRSQQGVLSAIDWTAIAAGTEASVAPILRQAFELTGTEATAQLVEALEFEMRFDITNPRAVEYARTAVGQKITVVTEETKEAVREIIAGAFRDQTTPRDAAKLIREIVGLNKPQARKVEKFRAQLVQDGVDPEVIERRVTKLTDSLRRKRARNIARHESMDASGAGQLEAWEQAAEEGLLPGGVEREVLVTRDDRLDLIVCEPMDGQRRGLRQPFTTGDGREMTNHPFHVLCRCATRLVFDKAGKHWVLWHGAKRLHVRASVIRG